VSLPRPFSAEGLIKFLPTALESARFLARSLLDGLHLLVHELHVDEFGFKCVLNIVAFTLYLLMVFELRMGCKIRVNQLRVLILMRFAKALHF